MAKIEIKFHNKITIRTLVQIFVGHSLISSGIAEPGETCLLSAETGQYDIFVKNGLTGRELARKLGGEAKSVTVSQHKGRYIVS